MGTLRIDPYLQIHWFENLKTSPGHETLSAYGDMFIRIIPFQCNFVFVFVRYSIRLVATICFYIKHSLNVLTTLFYCWNVCLFYSLIFFQYDYAIITTINSITLSHHLAKETSKKSNFNFGINLVIYIFKRDVERENFKVQIH